MDQSVIAYAEELRLERAKEITEALYNQDKDNIHLKQILNDIKYVLRSLKNK